jgi:O-succinylbenzoic acid--CoA ligase
MTRVRRLVVPRGPAVLGLLGDLERALAGGDAIQPEAEKSGPLDGTREETLEEVPDGVAVVIRTSGSSGTPKRTMLTADNLVASVTATNDMLGGAGRWLLAVSALHVAGMQVLVRSVVAGTTPEVLDLNDGFDPGQFADATDRMNTPSDRRYTALVPTQLTRLLDDSAGLRALRGFDAVLVGGAALSAADRERAAAVGVRVVTTYGMSETAGGCVYDGRPLPVTEVHIDNDHHVVLGGATVALGYLGQPRLTADAFAVDADGVRWFRTDDLGAFDDDGRLEIRGRADDLINTGGLKVAPGPVEDAIARFVPGVVDAVVVGTPHPTWGEAVSAAVTLRRGAPTPSLRDARAALRGVVPDHALPQRLLVLGSMPQRGPGKPDRRALIAAFSERLSEPGR